MILWVEKYRPQNSRLHTSKWIKAFQQFVENEEIPNLLLTGTGGVGKTTVAKAMLEEIGCTYMMINGSEDWYPYELKSKTLRLPFRWMVNVNTLFWWGRLFKSTINTTVAWFHWEFSKNCGFILTCNFEIVLLNLSQSLFYGGVSYSKRTETKLAMNFMKRVRHFGERKCFSMKKWWRCYQKFFQIGEDVSTNYKDTLQQALLMRNPRQSIRHFCQSTVSFVKDKDFKSCREWVVHNLTMTLIGFIVGFMILYLVMYPDVIPHCVLILGDYSYKSALSWPRN